MRIGWLAEQLVKATGEAASELASTGGRMIGCRRQWRRLPSAD